MVLTDAGEDDILYCDSCAFCVNAEITKQKEGEVCTRCSGGALSRAKASEVGNIFDLGIKYPKDFAFTYKTKDGTDAHPIMGCFGIGITRLMGVIAEAHSDERGLMWPVSVAPYRVHLLSLSPDDFEVSSFANLLYDTLLDAGIDVLYDERKGPGAGEKFKDSELIGIPLGVIVSKKTLAEGKLEIKNRKSGETEWVSQEELLARLQKNYI